MEGTRDDAVIEGAFEQEWRDLRRFLQAQLWAVSPRLVVAVLLLLAFLRFLGRNRPDSTELFPLVLLVALALPVMMVAQGWLAFRRRSPAERRLHYRIDATGITATSEAGAAWAMPFDALKKVRERGDALLLSGGTGAVLAVLFLRAFDEGQRARVRAALLTDSPAAALGFLATGATPPRLPRTPMTTP